MLYMFWKSTYLTKLKIFALWENRTISCVHTIKVTVNSIYMIVSINVKLLVSIIYLGLLLRHGKLFIFLRETV